MKTWQRIIRTVIIVTVMIAAALRICWGKKECCLCNSFRYHAPCLIDLETGEMVELALYDPHTTKIAELAEYQSEIDTFSFIRLGNVTGTKLTAQRTIELQVPVLDKTNCPSLCSNCRKLLQENYESRYILANLYETEAKRLIPIEDGSELCLRCYEISMHFDEAQQAIAIIVQGHLS